MDTIYREQAIDAMGCLNDSICEQQAVDALWELPSAEKIGKWVLRTGKYTTGKKWYRYVCSECEWTIENSYEVGKPYNYCPNCGARMVQ